MAVAVSLSFIACLFIIPSFFLRRPRYHNAEEVAMMDDVSEQRIMERRHQQSNISGQLTSRNWWAVCNACVAESSGELSVNGCFCVGARLLSGGLACRIAPSAQGYGTCGVLTREVLLGSLLVIVLANCTREKSQTLPARDGTAQEKNDDNIRSVLSQYQRLRLTIVIHASLCLI